VSDEDNVLLPYVIDNQSYKLSDILNDVMREHRDCSLDVATAYFSVSAFRLLREQLGTRSFRLLPEFQPVEGKDVGLRADLERAAFNEEPMRLVDDGWLARIRQRRWARYILPQ
jgi:hypothetical protein